jgi:hypothetical protein
MTALARLRRSLTRFLCVALALCLVSCSEDDDPISPKPPGSVAPTPVVIRSDAATYGGQDPVTLQSAYLEGMTLRLEVSYSGGCKDHVFAAVSPTGILPSMPPQIAVLLRHDAGGDQCEAALRQDLSFDITPLVEYLGPEPFHIRIYPPGSSEATVLLVPGT